MFSTRESILLKNFFNMDLDGLSQFLSAFLGLPGKLKNADKKLVNFISYIKTDI
jgi:hypothetical protein